jgi:hypothetical protein
VVEKEKKEEEKKNRKKVSRNTKIRTRTKRRV